MAGMLPGNHLAQHHAGEKSMGKYFIGWLLGVPLSLLVVIYVVSHTACGP